MKEVGKTLFHINYKNYELEKMKNFELETFIVSLGYYTFLYIFL